MKLTTAKGIKARYLLLFLFVINTNPKSVKNKTSIDEEMVLAENRKAGVSTENKRNKNLVSDSKLNLDASFIINSKEIIASSTGKIAIIFSGINATAIPSGKYSVQALF